MGPILGIIVLVLDIWAVLQTLQSPVSGGNKVLWVVIIFFLPVLGLILWGFLGPRAMRA